MPSMEITYLLIDFLLSPNKLPYCDSHLFIMTIIIYLQEIDMFAQQMVILHPHTFRLDNCHQKR